MLDEENGIVPQEDDDKAKFESPQSSSRDFKPINPKQPESPGLRLQKLSVEKE